MIREEEERKGFVHWGKGQSRSAALLVRTALMFNFLAHSSTQTHESSLWSKGVWLECTFTPFLAYPLKLNQSERLCNPKLRFSSVFNTVWCQMAFKFSIDFLPLSWYRHHEHTIILNAGGLHACSTSCPQREDSTASAFLAILMKFFFLNKVIIMYSTERTQVV